MAKSLYLRESMTQQELANRVGVSRVTISNWIRDGKWEEYKAGLTLTRKEQVNNLYRQVAEINKQIAERPEGSALPTPRRPTYSANSRHRSPAWSRRWVLPTRSPY